MPQDLLPPGAWLSGQAADLRPVGPPALSADLRPVGPPEASADLRPVGPPGARRLVPTPAPFPLPAEGAHPDWVYEGPAALLGQALRRSRARLVRPGDDRLTATRIHQVRQAGRAEGVDDLWRWDARFRVETVLCELAGRFHLQGMTLWLLQPRAQARRPSFTTVRVFEIGNPGRFPEDQVDKVLRAAVEREDRLPEILAQADDFWPFFESVVNIRLAAAPRFHELLNVAQLWAMQWLMGLKHGLGALRPVQCSTLVMPLIPTPGHGSLPSGHATVAALNAELLRLLLYAGGGAVADNRAELLDRLARRVAFNRVVAGVHFPVDGLVGYALGTQLARVLEALAQPEPAPLPAPVGEADIAALDPGGGRRLFGRPGRELPELSHRRLPQRPSSTMSVPAPSLGELWRRSGEELAELRV